MDIANAATEFSTTILGIIPIAIAVAISVGALYIFVIDYFRTRNRTKMWRDL